MYLDILVYLDRGGGLAALRSSLRVRVMNINIGLYTYITTFSP